VNSAGEIWQHRFFVLRRSTEKIIHSNILLPLTVWDTQRDLTCMHLFEQKEPNTTNLQKVSEYMKTCTQTCKEENEKAYIALKKAPICPLNVPSTPMLTSRNTHYVMNVNIWKKALKGAGNKCPNSSIQRSSCIYTI